MDRSGARPLPLLWEKYGRQVDIEVWHGPPFGVEMATKQSFDVVIAAVAVIAIFPLGAVADITNARGPASGWEAVPFTAQSQVRRALGRWAARESEGKEVEQ
jgi:hypothetical protein